ncbi:MAG: hypothetical protein HXY20_09645 [Acidobacteria bacterium]|nr:hypothetical protein [Acidobacteriota bacterium]
MIRRMLLLLWIGAVPQISLAADVKQPVFIYLFSRMEDHLNIEIWEDHLQQTLPMLERHRNRYPQYHAAALLQFTGAVSESLESRNRSNRLRDTILDLARKGIVETGYDGSEEPTYRTRARPNFRRAGTLEERWLARGEAAEWFLTEYRHPVTGEPDPERTGGLKKMLAVFGRAAFIGGYSEELGGDPESVHHIRRLAARAILPGIPESTTWPARDLRGYGGSVEWTGKLLSPEADTAPELFWQDGYLRCSNTSGPTVHVVYAHSGLAALKEMLEKLDRSRPHVIRVQLGEQGMFLDPAFEKSLFSTTIRYTYDNPKSARLPENAHRARPEIEAACDREAALLEWLAEEYFQANPGSRFILGGELLSMAQTRTDSSVPQAALRAATENLLAQWKETGNQPPNYARAGGDYFSLADMFQMLASSLAEFHRSGAMPPSVRLHHVYGPLDMHSNQGPSSGEVTVRSIARECVGLAAGLNDETWRPLPSNMIPAWISVDGFRLNAAQFLRLMGEAFLKADAGAGLRVRTCQMFSGLAFVFPYSRRQAETGATWTLKPALLRLAQ